MTIEKKSTLVDPSKVRIIENLLLVKPDENYGTYQRKGVDIGIATTNFAYDQQGKRVSIKERNYSVMGTVYAVPERLFFGGHIIDRHGVSNGYKNTPNGLMISDNGLADQIGLIRSRSLLYETGMEIKVGDRIRFSYTSHMDAEKKGMSVETTEGTMFFMRYDKAFMVVDGSGEPTKMLNGYILASPEKIETQNENGAEVKEAGNGIVIATLGKNENRKRKIMSGTCVLAGTPITANINFPGETEPDTEVNSGSKILFDPRGSKRLEPLNHQHHKDDLLLLHRRSLIFVSDEKTNFVEKLEQIEL